MAIFKAPLAYENKDAAFKGSGAFGLPRFNPDESDSGNDDDDRDSKVGLGARTPFVLVPPVVLPVPEPPTSPDFEEDFVALKKSLAELERDLAGLRLGRRVHGDGYMAEWRSFMDKVGDGGGAQPASLAAQETSRIRNRIAGIKEARQEEERRRREELLAANTAAASAAAKRKAEAEKMAAAEEEAKKGAMGTTTTVSTAELSSYEANPGHYEKAPTSNRALGIVEESRRVMEAVNKIRNSSDKAVKQRTIELRMLINRRVGQIANSSSQVFSVMKEMFEMATNVWRAEGNDMLNYVSYTLATKFIEQASKQISLHAPSAFPYGQTAVDLLANIPSFKTILMAMLIQSCPYVIPRYAPMLPGQTEGEYKASIGYKPGEGEAAYTERMSGIIAFYAAIIQSAPLRPGLTNPYDVKFAWLWLASLLNMPPRPITPYVLAAFFEIAGYRLERTYGQQFYELMLYLQSAFIPSIPSVSIAAKTRLKIYVDGVLRDRRVPEPEGLRIEGINYDLIERARSGTLPKPTAPPAQGQTSRPAPPAADTPAHGVDRPVFPPMAAGKKKHR